MCSPKLGFYDSPTPDTAKRAKDALGPYVYVSRFNKETVNRVLFEAVLSMAKPGGSMLSYSECATFFEISLRSLISVFSEKPIGQVGYAEKNGYR